MQNEINAFRQSKNMINVFCLKSISMFYVIMLTWDTDSAFDYQFKGALARFHGEESEQPLTPTFSRSTLYRFTESLLYAIEWQLVVASNTNIVRGS